MNLFCMTLCGVNIIFKTLLPQGVTVPAFTLCRNFANFMVISVSVWSQGRRPFSDFPVNRRWTMFFRSMLGTAGFVGMTYNLTLLPMAIIMIIF